MNRKRRRAAIGLGALLALGAGCAVETVRQRAYPRLEEGIEPISKVAVAPFAPAGEIADEVRRAEIEASVTMGTPPREVGPTPGEATALVARFFSEALAKQGLDVTTHEDVERVLAEAGATGLAPREVARLAHERFGAQAVAVGTVARYRERTGGAQEAGAASVWFEVALYTAPAGEKLWAGVFNETQRPLTNNVLVASRYPGGGSRWLSAEELARWGAEQMALTMPVGSTVGTSGPRP
jgi:hypothetical protein